MSDKKLLIFDFDGVIVDTENIHFLAINQILKSYAISIDINQWRYEYIGLRTRSIFKKIFPRISEQELNVLVERKRMVYNYLIDNSPISARPGVIRLIQKAKEYDVILSVASSSSIDEIKNTLVKLKILNYFNKIVSVDQVKHPKPSPDIYLFLLNYFSVSRRHCIVIEDSPTGIISAKSAGIYCIAYPNEFTLNLDLSEADEIIKEFGDCEVNHVLDLLLSRGNRI